jgi:ribonuclease-3
VAPKDAKTALQEKVQGSGKPPPQYRTVDKTGPDHKPVFTVEVSIEGGSATGKGASRRSAEQDAAQILLNSLEEKTHG